MEENLSVLQVSPRHSGLVNILANWAVPLFRVIMVFLMIAELEAVIVAFCLAVLGLAGFLETLHSMGVDLDVILMPVYLVFIGFVGFIEILFSILIDFLKLL